MNDEFDEESLLGPYLETNIQVTEEEEKELLEGDILELNADVEDEEFSETSSLKNIPQHVVQHNTFTRTDFKKIGQNDAVCTLSEFRETESGGDTPLDDDFDDDDEDEKSHSHRDRFTRERLVDDITTTYSPRVDEDKRSHIPDSLDNVVSLTSRSRMQATPNKLPASIPNSPQRITSISDRASSNRVRPQWKQNRERPDRRPFAQQQRGLLSYNEAQPLVFPNALSNVNAPHFNRMPYGVQMQPGLQWNPSLTPYGQPMGGMLAPPMSSLPPQSGFNVNAPPEVGNMQMYQQFIRHPQQIVHPQASHVEQQRRQQQWQRRPGNQLASPKHNKETTNISGSSISREIKSTVSTSDANSTENIRQVTVVSEAGKDDASRRHVDIEVKRDVPELTKSAEKRRIGEQSSVPQKKVKEGGFTAEEKKRAQQLGVDLDYLRQYEARLVEMEEKRQEIARKKEERRQQLSNVRKKEAATSRNTAASLAAGPGKPRASVTGQTQNKPAQVRPSQPIRPPQQRPQQRPMSRMQNPINAGAVGPHRVQGMSATYSQSPLNYPPPSGPVLQQTQPGVYQQMPPGQYPPVSFSGFPPPPVPLRQEAPMMQYTVPVSTSGQLASPSLVVRVSQLPAFTGDQDLKSVINLFGAGEITQVTQDRRNAMVNFSSVTIAQDFVCRCDGLKIRGNPIRATFYS